LDNGEHKEAWIVDYTDQDGDRHIRRFDRKKDADAFSATVGVEVRAGLHTAPAKSITVAAAGDNWISFVEGEGRERTTVDSYRLHLRLHINPRLGETKLAALTKRQVEDFRDRLVKGLSKPMARKVLGSLKMLLKDAHRRGDVAQNVAIGTTIKADKRGKRRRRAQISRCRERSRASSMRRRTARVGRCSWCRRSPGFEPPRPAGFVGMILPSALAAPAR
jgi:integrase